MMTASTLSEHNVHARNRGKICDLIRAIGILQNCHESLQKPTMVLLRLPGSSHGSWIVSNNTTPPSPPLKNTIVRVRYLTLVYRS